MKIVDLINQLNAIMEEHGEETIIMLKKSDVE